MYPVDSPNQLPAAQGLYDPANERDACGIGFVVNIGGDPSHDIVLKGLQILENLVHRGACGCDPETGDGAGILIQIPHRFFAREADVLGFSLPEPGEYGIAMCFCPSTGSSASPAKGFLERITREEGLTVLGWRDTPLSVNAIGRVARASQPYIEQLFVGRPPTSIKMRSSASFTWFVNAAKRPSLNPTSETKLSSTFPLFFAHHCL